MSNRGQVEKRGDSWGFRASFTDDAGIRRHIRRADKRWTKKDAQRALTETLAQIDAGHALGSATQTVADYLLGWLDTYGQTADVKPGTIHQHRINVERYIIPRIGNLRMSDVKRARVARFVADLTQTVGNRSHRTLSPKTVRNITSTLSRAFADAVDHQVITRNPCERLSLPRWERPELRPWDGEQVGRFLAYCDAQAEPHAALYRLALLHGLRRGELAGLRWVDVDFDAATVSVAQTRVMVGSQQVTQSPKTKSGRRTISIDPGTLDALGRLHAQQIAQARALDAPEFALVATRADGQPIHPDRLLTRFRTLAADAGLPVTRLHDARHASATMMLTMGAPIQVVSAHLGHSKPSITLDVYAHALPKADRLAADAIGAAIDAIIAQQPHPTDGRGMDAEWTRNQPNQATPSRT